MEKSRRVPEVQRREVDALVRLNLQSTVGRNDHRECRQTGSQAGGVHRDPLTADFHKQKFDSQGRRMQLAVTEVIGSLAKGRMQ